VELTLTLGSIGVRTTPTASLLYSLAARRLAERAVRLDDLERWKALDEPGRRELESELIEISLAAVVTGSSSVEAAVNELFLERAEFDQAV